MEMVRASFLSCGNTTCTSGDDDNCTYCFMSGQSRTAGNSLLKKETEKVIAASFNLHRKWQWFSSSTVFQHYLVSELF